nr:MAG: ORF1a [Bat astrovirus]
MGVHLSNTGFTGGGAVLLPSDLHEETEVEKLRREIEELRSKGKPPLDGSSSPSPLGNSDPTLNQAFRMDDIVNLVREAVRNEMLVLRAELAGQSDDFDQAKGKTKRKVKIAHGARMRKNKRNRAWTEEEYKKLQEQGYTRDQLQDMAHEILERMALEDGSEYIDGPFGFPKWEAIDEEDKREIESEWFNHEHDDYVRDSYRQADKVVVDLDYNPKTHPHDVYDKYSLTMYYITPMDLQYVGKDIKEYEDFLLVWMMKNLTSSQEWRAGVETEKELKELALKKQKLDTALANHGLVPFIQRKKKDKKPRTIKEKPKNSQSPPSGGHKD